MILQHLMFMSAIYLIYMPRHEFRVLHAHLETDSKIFIIMYIHFIMYLREDSHRSCFTCCQLRSLLCWPLGTQIFYALYIQRKRQKKVYRKTKHKGRPPVCACSTRGSVHAGQVGHGHKDVGACIFVIVCMQDEIGHEGQVRGGREGMRKMV